LGPSRPCRLESYAPLLDPINLLAIIRVTFDVWALIIEPLWKEGNIEECVKEGACDAYKFLRMQANGPDTYEQDDRKWFSKIECFKTARIKDILAKAGDRPHDIIHGIPASRILVGCDTLAKLRDLLSRGLTATDITDPDGDLPGVLRSCWDRWNAMAGKNEDEKRLLKHNIEAQLSSAFP